MTGASWVGDATTRRIPGLWTTPAERLPLWMGRDPDRSRPAARERQPKSAGQNSPLGSSSSLLASSSTLTSLKVTTRTVLANRAGR